MVNVAVLGSGFIPPQVFINEIKAQGVDARYTTLDLPWPGTPRGNDDEIQEYAGDFDDVVRTAQNAEALVTDLAPVNEYILGKLPNLKFIGVSRGGPVNINIPAATKRGIVVVNAPGRNGPAVAEYTVSLMLALVRRLETGIHDLKDGKWQGDLYSYNTAAFELEGHTVGLVGFGKVGSRVASLLRAFDMRVLVYDPFVSDDAVTSVGAEHVDLDELLGQSDFVTIHARLTPDTRGIIGTDQLAKMPDGSYLINTARSPLVDYDALTSALESGKLAGAAIDVYSSEPPDLSNRLFSQPNLIAMPHVGGATQESAQRGARMVAADLKQYVSGGKLTNCKNREVLK